MNAIVKRTSIAALVTLLLLAGPATAQFEWDKRVADAPLPNPSLVRASRDKTAEYVRKVLDFYGHEVKSFSCDDARGTCLFLTEPLVFTRGIVADSQYRHVAELGASDVRHVVRGRVTVRVEVAPVNPGVTSVSVVGTFEGLAEGATGSEWITSRSRGMYEDRLLRGISRLAYDLPIPEDRSEQPAEPVEERPVTPGRAKNP